MDDRVLIKGGYVLSLDPEVGEIEGGAADANHRHVVGGCVRDQGARDLPLRPGHDDAARRHQPAGVAISPSRSPA